MLALPAAISTPVISSGQTGFQTDSNCIVKSDTASDLAQMKKNVKINNIAY